MLFISTLFIACDKDTDINTNGTLDMFEGAARELYFTNSTENLVAKEGVCLIKGPKGVIFKRDFTHMRENGKSMITLNKGLSDGNYTLLYFKGKQIDGKIDTHTSAEEEVENRDSYGMGCTFCVSGATTTILSTYNEDFDMYGSGTETDPFIVS